MHPERMITMNEYSETCDYLRKRFDLHEGVSIYDIIARCLTEIHDLEKQLIETKSQKEKSNVGTTKGTKRRTRSSNN